MAGALISPVKSLDRGPRNLSETPGLSILIRKEAAHRISLQPQPEIILPLFIDTMQTIVIFIFAH